MKVGFHFVKNVARVTAALLKLNRFLLGSIRKLQIQKEKVARDILHQLEIHLYLKMMALLVGSSS